MNIKRLLKEHITLFEVISELENFNISQDDILEILKGYLEAALWTEEERLKGEYEETIGYGDEDFNIDSNNDELEQLMKQKQTFTRDSISSFGVDNLESNSKIQAYLDIKKFIKLAGVDAIKEAVNEHGFFRLGMDIWLTRNRHGAGFFDRNYDNEQTLVTAAHNLGEVDLYLNDEMSLSFSNA